MTLYATTHVTSAPLGHAALVLEGKPCGIARRLSGGAVGAHVVEATTPGTGQLRKQIGPPVREDLSLDFGFAMARPVFDWIAETWKLQAPRRDGAFLACDQGLIPKSQRRFTQALITETTLPALRAGSKEAAWLNLKLAVESLQLEAASGGKVSGDPKHAEKLLLAEGFRLEIDGLDCEKVRAIDRFTVRQAVHRHHTPDGIELAAGAVSFPDLAITLAEVASGSWQAWLEDFVLAGNNSEEHEKKGKLTLLSDQKQTLATIRLDGLGIFQLGHAEAAGAGEHHMLATARLYCQSMALEPAS